MDYAIFKRFTSETDENRCEELIQGGWILLAVTAGVEVNSSDGSQTPYPYFLLGHDKEASDSDYSTGRITYGDPKDIPEPPAGLKGMELADSSFNTRGF